MTLAVSAPGEFDLFGRLPEGTTVLEASAGTGKTFTIAALVARYVAEGVAAMDDLLVVSFSRESTRELRERVRERLVSARDGLADPTSVDANDQLLMHLTAGVHTDEVDRRRHRLEEALAVFDAATVTTTHGFCQQVLLTLGTAGDYDSGAALIENIGDLVSEVADDLYLRKWGCHNSGKADLTPKEFQELAFDAAKDPATLLLPDDPAVDGMPGMRARIAAAVRAEVDLRKRRQRLIDYDDMLIRLNNTLTDPGSGPVACRRLRDRYRVVLVDEFQDTDPVQWSILRHAFHGHRTLVLIGDPKQAIYGFRGADVHAYLEAKGSAGTVATLPTNWRSDAPLLDGLDAVFRGAALGDSRIRVVPVTAEHTGRMVDAASPVRLRVLSRDDFALNQRGLVAKPEAVEAIGRDLAVEVVALLAGGVTLRSRVNGPNDGPNNGLDNGPERHVLPGDIAVLVRDHNQAHVVQSCLREAGVPVVLTGKSSVFATRAAQEWQLMLEALEQPHRTTRVRRLVLSCFVGLNGTELDARGDPFVDDLALRLRVWAKAFEDRGVAALFETVSLEESVQRRVLGQPDGERLLTDLRHIAEGLHEASLEGQLGLTALLAWLRRRRDEAGREGGQERSRRLETDAAAVQVITVHTSKGLEFPVVMVPFAWNVFGRDNPVTAVFHDDHDQRVRDVGGTGSPDWQEHVRRHKQEEVDDELRLTYVAMTRAQSHLLLWWAPTFNTPLSPLQRLLLHDDQSVVAPLSIKVPDDATALAAFRARAAGSRGGLAVEVMSLPHLAMWSPTGQPSPVLDLARFTRRLDSTWGRTSYSALTSSAHDQTPSLGSEPEVAQKDDESDIEEVSGVIALAPSGDEGLRAVASLWDALPGGAAFGTMVHTVLEQLADPADEEAVRAVVAVQVARYSPGTDAGSLAAGLIAAVSTPMGSPTDERALRDLVAADRLSELVFELPLVGGDEPGAAEVLLGDLVPLWREHCPTGSLSSYADALADLAPAPLRGYLTGSIDAVLRVGEGESRRYLVVDYKTNRLGSREQPLTAWNYRQSAMERAMVEAHYPLQALLYDVALHRYLRWRHPGYDPAIQLGGVCYLFLRGMCGPDVRSADGSVPGVFSWRPPTALVTGMSDLLAGLR
jgi:exodeoxyribonuclease V beta subunit